MTQEELFADSDDKSRQPNNSSFFLHPFLHLSTIIFVILL